MYKQMLNSQFWEIRKRQGLLFTILSNWLSFLRNLVNFIIRKIALCATHFQGGQTKFPENVNVACKGHESGNKKPQRAIENEFNMQKLVKLTHFLFFVINLSLISDNFRMSLWNNRFSQNPNEKISKISALASKERSN